MRNVRTECDAILINDTFFIFNHKSFEFIFSFVESYTSFIKENRDIILSSNIICNPQALFDYCSKSSRHLKRLVKAIKRGAFEGLDYNRVEQVISDYGLEVRMNNGAIIFTEQTASEILKIILREYVIDQISDNKMIASGISDYSPIVAK